MLGSRYHTNITVRTKTEHRSATVLQPSVLLPVYCTSVFESKINKQERVAHTVVHENQSRSQAKHGNRRGTVVCRSDLEKNSSLSVEFGNCIDTVSTP